MIKKISTKVQNILLKGVSGIRKGVDCLEYAIRWMF